MTEATLPAFRLRLSTATPMRSIMLIRLSLVKLSLVSPVLPSPTTSPYPTSWLLRTPENVAISLMRTASAVPGSTSGSAMLSTLKTTRILDVKPGRRVMIMTLHS